MTVVYLVLLRKGPNWTAQETPETKALQEAHMANIRAMWQARKLIVAGPFGDGGDFRGLLLFQVASLEEAKALGVRDAGLRFGYHCPATSSSLRPRGRSSTRSPATPIPRSWLSRSTSSTTIGAAPRPPGRALKL